MTGKQSALEEIAREIETRRAELSVLEGAFERLSQLWVGPGRAPVSRSGKKKVLALPAPEKASRVSRKRDEQDTAIEVNGKIINLSARGVELVKALSNAKDLLSREDAMKILTHNASAFKKRIAEINAALAEAGGEIVQIRGQGLRLEEIEAK